MDIALSSTGGEKEAYVEMVEDKDEAWNSRGRVWGSEGVEWGDERGGPRGKVGT